AHTRVEHVSTNVFHDEIDAALAHCGEHLFAQGVPQIACTCIDDMVSARGFRGRRFLGTAYRCEHGGPERLSDLNGSQTYAAGRAGHQHTFAGPDAATFY